MLTNPTYRQNVSAHKLFSKVKQRVSGSELQFFYKDKRIGSASINNGIMEMDFQLPEKLRNKGIGTKMFTSSLNHFGSEIRGIRGAWLEGDNLNTLNEGLRNKLTLTDAVFSTPTGKWAKK